MHKARDINTWIFSEPIHTEHAFHKMQRTVSFSGILGAAAPPSPHGLFFQKAVARPKWHNTERRLLAVELECLRGRIAAKLDGLLPSLAGAGCLWVCFSLQCIIFCLQC